MREKLNFKQGNTNSLSGVYHKESCMILSNTHKDKYNFNRMMIMTAQFSILSGRSGWMNTSIDGKVKMFIHWKWM